MNGSALSSRDGGLRTWPVEDRRSPALGTAAFLLLYLTPSLFGWWLILAGLRHLAGAVSALLP